MRYRVYLVVDAEDDLFDICRYIARSDSPHSARKVLTQVQRACQTLASLPGRGHVPPELERVAVFDYREIHCRPYRIIYRVDGKSVFVHAVLDGRRDLHELLERRLFRG